MSAPNEFFTVSRVCRLTGLAPEVLDQVAAALGDQLEVQRTPAGNRLFTADALDRLREARRLLDEEGLSLDQVRAALFPEPDPADTLPAWDQTAAGADGPDAPVGAADGDEPVLAMASDVEPAAGVDMEPQVPGLPVVPTVDLLLEAAEGLVQENLKLRKAVDRLGERCLRLEQRLDRPASGLLQRLFGRG